MKKEDILKAIKEVLAENTGQVSKITGRTGETEVDVVTPKEKEELVRAGAKVTPMEEEAMVSLNDFVSYLANRLEQVWKLGTGKNPVNYEEMARFIATDLGLVKSVNEDLDLGHEDDEPHMIKSELYKVAKYALELYKMVDQFEGKGEVDFPAWWQSKITKATSMISSAKHYLEFELTEPAMDQAVVGAEVPINEGNLGHNELASLEPEGRFWIVTYRTMDGKKEKVFTDEDEARAFMGTVSETKKKLDPVGKEDSDIDNDGEVGKTDKYLKNRRVKIGKAIASHKK